MSQNLTLAICLLLGLWTALEGGVFKAFSEFIMRSLLQAEPAGGIESMQRINVVVLRTEFVFAILALAPVTLVFAGYAMLTLEGPACIAIVAAALVYVSCVFLMTLLGNVPMNEKLAKMDYRSAEAADYWQEYGQKWTRLNHFRTWGCVIASGLYLSAAYLLMVSGQLP
jgi:uncharacterized membrane protein